ncbi:NAD-dependent epimerase/dehydratase family protein [Aurantiacibacter zhengii]|uniref:NAD-dependent epimerase/dehydratase family protein n=1 Tax=Aurantiacibacter zhengii TaxID=2307003 RepID=A0A418NUY7_9SPHN|nr:NAD(P)H-binding protein [Aurantiacibacter zhengii]RIV87831.1 NAD-dependent epimerase/dehydratase family protein [Aurantiacibacter zhengii]
MTIAITGGTGFVGRAVLDQAATRGRAARALARREQDARDGVSWIKGDLSSHDALDRLMQGATAVIHIAGVVNAPDAEGFFEGNAQGTRNVVAAAQRGGVRRFVHVSSLAAREPDLSLYGQSKRQAEHFLEDSDLDWTIVRPPAVYGPRDTEIFELFKAARWGLLPMPPAGRTSIIHVDDLARLLLDLVDSPADSQPRVLEPDDGKDGGWSHKQLAHAIGAAMGKSVWAPHVPRGVLMGAARLDRLLRGDRAKLTLDRASYMAHPDWTSSPDRAVPARLWSPQIGTKDGLAETARWYKVNNWL